MKTNSVMNSQYYRGFIVGLSISDNELDMLSKKYLSKEDYILS